MSVSVDKKMTTTTKGLTAADYASELRNVLGKYGVSTSDTARGGFDVPHKRVSDKAYRAVTGSVHIGAGNPRHISVDLYVRPVHRRDGDGTRQVGRETIASFSYSGDVLEAPSPEIVERRLELGSLDFPVVEPGTSGSTYLGSSWTY